MSSSGSWSMMARATVSPPTPESNTPMGASALLMSTQLLPRCRAPPLPGLAFRVRQQVRGEHAGDPAAEVSLPGPPAADVEHRDGAPQDSAVGKQHHHP